MAIHAVEAVPETRTSWRRIYLGRGLAPSLAAIMTVPTGENGAPPPLTCRGSVMVRRDRDEQGASLLSVSRRPDVVAPEIAEVVAAEVMPMT